MNLNNLFENDNAKPGANYAEELAHQIFKVAPDLDATGVADEVLDYAFDLAVNDLGRRRAHSLFAYDQDFDSDLVSAYAYLQRQDADKDMAEGWKGELAGGTIGGIAGNLAGTAIAGPWGGIVGGAAGGAGGGIIGRELTKEEQLNEFAPLLAAGARLVITMAPKIAQVLKSTGQATARAAAPVAKSGAEIAAKNAGQIGLGLGAYEVGSSVAEIAKEITAKVGTALEEKTIMELAQVAFKFAIPAGIVLAILYGGKKVIDSLFSDSKEEQGVAEGDVEQLDKTNPILDIATRASEDSGMLDGYIRNLYDYVNRNNMENDPKWKQAEKIAKDYHFDWSKKNGYPSANTNPELARKGEKLRHRVLVNAVVKVFGQQGVAEGGKQLDEIGDTPAGRAALQKYQDKAHNQVAAHWKQVHDKSYLPTDPKMAKRNAGTVAAGNRTSGYGIDKNQQDKVTGRFKYRDAVGKTHVYQKNSPLEQGVAEGDMYGDQEVSWEKGGRRAPTGAFRNPNAEKMILHPETYDLIDEYIAKIEPDADREEIARAIMSGHIDTSELEYALQDEDLNEFAPPGGEGGPSEDEILFRLAKQWWLGTEQDMIRAERTLASMGWEIGEDDGYDDGGVFVVRAGDENGKSYQSWSNEELEGLSESYPKHQDLSGISTEKLKAYLAKQAKQSVPGEGAQVKRVKAELQRREQGVAEASWHSEPEQERMDAIRQSRLNREREPRGSEAIDARIRAQHDQLDQYNQSGRFWLKQKDTQEHISDAMIGKAAANAAAAEMLKQRPELQGNLVITAYGPGESQGVKESRMSELDAEYQDYKKLSPREFYNMYRVTKQEWMEKYKRALPQKGIAEADKKKEDEPEVRDVALQRAISRAKADFPAAGSGIEALAKDFMRSQDQDSKSFDQLRRAERKQDQMLGQIAKIDQEQGQEIQDLENQNSSLASRLQQLQNVNNDLEKKLAAMSGRRAEKTSKSADVSTALAPVSTSTKAATPKVTAKKKTADVEPTTSKAIGQIAKTLAPDASSLAFDRMSQELQPRQKELGFDEPVTIKPKKFDTSKASDAEYRELTSKIAKDIVSRPDAARVFNPNAMQGMSKQQEMSLENKDKPNKSARPEVDYDDPKWDAMVARVRKLAGEGPRKTVWDPVKRVYKTVPVNK